MAELVIRVPGEPFAQPRARAAVIAGRAVIYDPKKAKNWKAAAQQHMVYALDEFRENKILLGETAGHLLGPVALRVLAVFTCPKTDHRKRDPRPRRWHVKRPDGDNVLKAVKDAAKGVLWLDDSQVCQATVTKIIGAQGEAPFVEIRVRGLSEESVDEGGGCPRSDQEQTIRPCPTPTSNPAPADATTPAGVDLPLFEEIK